MFRLCNHAIRQAEEKGIHTDAVLRAANDPTVTYANRRYPNQRRHIRDGICAVVDPVEQKVVTFYLDVVETPLRPDQTDRAAHRYGRRVKQIA